MTEDVLLTLSLLLVAALAARFVASLLPVPEIIVLLAMGAVFGPHALDVIDVPIDSLGAQLDDLLHTFVIDLQGPLW